MNRPDVLAADTGVLRELANSRLVLALALLAVVLRTLFYFYVDRTWEDALITVLHAENFWRGGGLTHFHNGQGPVHGFTSPLSVLIPLFGEMFGQGYGLKLIKLVSIGAGAWTVVYAYAICRHPKIALPQPLAAMVAAYMALEYQQILWGMAGLETQLVTLILLMSCFYLLQEDERSDWQLGMALGFCMLARPDMIFWCVLAWGLAFARSRPAAYKVLLVAALVYGPWLVFAQWYYGSIIPNTIFAKEAVFGGYPLPTGLEDLWRKGRWSHIFAPLGPAFAGYGTGFQRAWGGHKLTLLMSVLACLGVVHLLEKKRNAAWGLPLFFIVYAVYFLYFVPVLFSWYLSPINAVAIILAATGIKWVWQHVSAPENGRALYAVCGLYLAIMSSVLPLFFKTEKQVQENIENAVRREIGLYLGNVMKPTETVSLEPLGYSSYYSHKDVYDTPGLANKRVVDYFRSIPRAERTLFNLVKHFHSDYVVLRPGNSSMEYGYFLRSQWFRSFYGSDRAFTVDGEKLASMWYSNATYDDKFVVFRKRRIVGSVGWDDWLPTNGRPMLAGAELASVPPYPSSSSYLLSGAGIGAGGLLSRPIGVTAPFKIVLYAKGEDVCNNIAAFVEQEARRVALVCSAEKQSPWSQVALEFPFKGTAAGPVRITIHADQNAADAPLVISQPFLLAADEGVAEFDRSRP